MATVARETSGPRRRSRRRCEHSPVARETGGEAADAPPAPPDRRLPSRIATAALLLPIRLYRRLISPLLGPRCRYYPTCSSYAEQALRELGPIRGTIVAAWRVMRCNPLSSGGLDPLENRRLFRSGEPEPPPNHHEAI